MAISGIGELAMNRDDIESFLYKEAQLLDEGKYEEWLDLYTDDARYWIPSWATEEETVEQPDWDLSLINLDRVGLEDFVMRWQSGNAHALQPAPRTNRIITNVLFDRVGDEEQHVFCKWTMQVYRKDIQELFGGHCEYRIKSSDERLKISFKKVTVLNDMIGRGHFMLF